MLINAKLYELQGKEVKKVNKKHVYFFITM